MNDLSKHNSNSDFASMVEQLTFYPHKKCIVVPMNKQLMPFHLASINRIKYYEEFNNAKIDFHVPDDLRCLTK